MNSGGRITLDEPLSLDELQTGALVLRVSRNGAPPVDATLVVTLRSATEIGSAGFYAYGTQVLQVGSGGDLQRGDFTVSVVDRSASWQVVGFRVDRQYWYGGSVNEQLNWLGEDGSGPPNVGAACVCTSRIVVNGAEEYVQVMLDGTVLGGVWLGDAEGGAIISSGSASVHDGVEFSQAAFSLGLRTIKAVPVSESGMVSIYFLYPFITGQHFTTPLMHEGTEIVTSPTTPGPYYLGDI